MMASILLFNFSLFTAADEVAVEVWLISLLLIAGCVSVVTGSSND